MQSALACPKGVCADCNGNGILDQCDLNCASPCGGCNVPGCGGSSDCNSNGVPDECDIASGASPNCNGNAVPDECESLIGTCCAGTTCTVEAQICCNSQGGTFTGVGTTCQDCNGNAIADACEAPVGACCVGTTCTVGAETCCIAYGGTFGGAGTYCEDCNVNGVPAPCEGPTTREYGACSTPQGGCIIATDCSCQGLFRGVGTVCQADVGACCLNGTCTNTSELSCLYQGGTFKGANYSLPQSSCGTDCNLNGVDDACESFGACCKGSSCSLIPEACCIKGTFNRLQTRCGGNCNNNSLPDGCEAGTSDPFGACCVGGALCGVMLASCCTTRAGTFGGAGTYCEDCNGNGVPAPCEGFATREYGACCKEDGGCNIATQCSCQGSFVGVGTTCFLQCAEPLAPQLAPPDP